MTKPTKNFACVFDYDGVISKDDKPIKGVKNHLLKLSSQKIPFLICTNGGGNTEQEMAQHFTKIINSDINEEEDQKQNNKITLSEKQIILSHTPLLKIIQNNFIENSNSKQNNNNNNNNNKGKVLVLGRSKEKNFKILKNYGLKKEQMIYIDDFLQKYTFLVPYFLRLHKKERTQFTEKQYQELEETQNQHKISSIFVLETPVDWHSSCQVLVDILSTNEGKFWQKRNQKNLKNYQQIPIYFSNPDLVYSGQFTTPRFTQGAFRTCLQVLFNKMTNKELKYIQLGKPSKFTYNYVKQVLKELNNNNNNDDNEDLDINSIFKTVYAIGDNPKSDIKGANENGFFSILTKTGVFQGEVNDEVNPADKVVFDINEGLKFIFKRENIN